MKMNQSNEDSITWEFTGFCYCEDSKKLENNEKGFTSGDYKEKKGNEKNPELIQEIQIGKVGKAELLEDGTLIIGNSKKIENFADYKNIYAQKADRKTKYATSSKDVSVGLE